MLHRPCDLCGKRYQPRTHGNLLCESCFVLRNQIAVCLQSINSKRRSLANVPQMEKKLIDKKARLDREIQELIKKRDVLLKKEAWRKKNA